MARAVKKIYEYSAQCGARIAAVRKQRGLTLKALAAKVGFSQQMMSKIERGETNIPTESLVLIAQALDVPVAEFFPDTSPSVITTRLHYWFDHQRHAQAQSLRDVAAELDALGVF